MNGASAITEKNACLQYDDDLRLVHTAMNSSTLYLTVQTARYKHCSFAIIYKIHYINHLGIIFVDIIRIFFKPDKHVTCLKQIIKKAAKGSIVFVFLKQRKFL